MVKSDHHDHDAATPPEFNFRPCFFSSLVSRMSTSTRDGLIAISDMVSSLDVRGAASPDFRKERISCSLICLPDSD